MDEMEESGKAVEGALSTRDLQRPLPEKFYTELMELIRANGREAIAVRGTEIIVAATGVLSERDIAETKGQLEVLGREPIAAVRNLAGAGQSPGRPAAIHLSVSASPSLYLAQL